MYIFLDESGDLGFDFENKKPSLHFVITLLVFHSQEVLLNLKAVVKHTLKHKVRIKNKNSASIHELKGTETTFATKQYFYKHLLQRLRDCDWALHTLILDKKQLLACTGGAIPNTQRLYNILSYEVLKQIDFTKTNNSIDLVVDLCKASKDRKVFNNFVQTNLEARLPINVNLHIKHELSNNSVGLQVVDLFCWGIFRKYTLNDCDWYNLFHDKIVCEELYKM